MPTTITKSIGTTGRDYSTLQSWEDAAPANLVTSDQIWLGECYNDATFTAALTISGSTSDSTRYKKLTAAAGQSFADTPSNALRYNASNGATLSFSGGYATALTVNEAHAKLSRMQVKTAGTNERTLSLAQTGVVAEDCILAGNPGSSGFSGNVVQVNDSTTLRNCLVEKQNTNASGHGIYLSRATVVNCTIVNISGTAAAKGMLIVYSGSSCVVRNNAVFGFTTAADSVGGTHQTNYCDVTSPGSGWTGGIAFSTSTFANVTAGTWDLKLVPGSALLDVGTTDATHGTPDIFGTARPSGSAYDVGAWEYVGGGGGPSFTAKSLKPLLQAIGGMY